MHISLIAIGTRMPQWVNDGFKEFTKRLPKDYQLSLLEIPAEKRLKQTDLTKAMAEESERLINAAPAHDIIIALDRLGKTFSTPELARKLERWHDTSQSISILVGGPEGISREVLSRVQEKWSLSELTLPHPMVRVLIAEQCYRAWSIITNHPYHR